MLLDLLIAALTGIINAIMSLLPQFELPTPDIDAGIFPTISALDNVVPVGDAVVILLLIITVILALYIWDFALFVYHQFWGSG